MLRQQDGGGGKYSMQRNCADADMHTTSALTALTPAMMSLTIALTAVQEWTASKMGKWIPVSERLPELPYGCLVTVWDTDFITMDEFENILPYFVGWDGEQWNDADGAQCPFEVIAWMPLPAPYKDGEQDEV